MGISDKIETIAKEIYGAGSVSYSPAAKKAIAKITEMGFGDLPVCMAKTQYSLSDDQKKLGRPEGFDLTVRDVYVCAGAGFVVALTGAIMTMPGLPKKPAADNIDVDENHRTVLNYKSERKLAGGRFLFPPVRVMGKDDDSGNWRLVKTHEICSGFRQSGSERG